MVQPNLEPGAATVQESADTVISAGHCEQQHQPLTKANCADTLLAGYARRIQGLHVPLFDLPAAGA